MSVISKLPGRHSSRISLQVKFILVITILLMAIFASLTYELISLNARNLRNDLSQQSQSFAALAVKPIGNTFLTYKDSGVIQVQQQIQQFLDLDSNIANVVIADTGGAVEYSQKTGGPTQISQADAATFEQITKADSAGTITSIYTPFVDDNGIHQYVVAYTISPAQLQASLNQAVWRSVLIGLSGLIISLLATFFLMDWLFIRPIDQISRQALAISQGSLEQQIEVVRSDEIGDLATALNVMTNSLKSDIQKLREVDALKSEFMMISSHNLRTPLTVIQGYLEAIKELKLGNEAEKLVEIVSANTARLMAFAENMLVISQMEAGSSENEEVQTINTTEFLNQIGEQLRTLAVAKGLKSTITIPPNLPALFLQPRRFHDALWNTLDNALKFTASGGTISLVVEPTTAGLEIRVQDSGIGISQEELPKLFTKFHRGTSTLTYDYEGTGIGLYLAKLIITQQGGQISVASELGKGTTVTTTLPVKPVSP